MSTLKWNAEGGTDGTDITAANSGGASGDPFDSVTKETGATLAYSTTGAAHGKLAAKLATGGTAAGTYLTWSTSVSGMASTFYFRTYLYFTANPAAEHRLLRIGDASGATIRGLILIDTSGKIGIAGNNSTVNASNRMATAISLNTPVRFEAKIVVSTSSTCVLRLYNTADSATSTEEKTASTSLNFGATTYDSLRIGSSAAQANVTAFYMDDIAVGDVDYFGPVTAGIVYGDRRIRRNTLLRR